MCNSQNDKGLQKLRAVSPTRRRFLQGGAAAMLSAPFVTRRSWAAEPLYVNTWGGRWEASAKKHLFDPFSKETGIEIRTVSPVSYAKLAAQARTGVYEFDVTTLGAVELVQAAEADIIEAIGDRQFDAEKIPETSVFMNGLASHVFSTNICYNRDKHPNGPQSWKEFWDVEKNPGSRSMRRYAWDCLPPALMADGVTQDQIYPIDGDRAFKSLDALKEHIRVWWLQGNQAQQLIRDGEVDYIAIWHGQVQILQDQGIPLELVWNEALHSEVYWVVSKGTPRKEAAWMFAEFAASPEPLAGFCTDAVYGPMNPKSFEFIAEDVQKNMPTYPDNMKTAIHQKAELIGPDFTPLMRRFDQWIAS
jgi:putative spermidine/putrescine transport system substrate-binding protein